MTPMMAAVAIPVTTNLVSRLKRIACFLAHTLKWYSHVPAYSRTWFGGH